MAAVRGGEARVAGHGRLRLRVVIADDHPLLVDGVRQSLDEAGGFEVVGTARSGGEAVAAVKRTSPDVVLLDIKMPGIDGLVCLDRIREFSSEVKVIVLSGLDDPELIENVLRRGAVAFVVKSVNPDDLPYVIRQAVAQTVFASAHLAPSRSDTGGTAKELSSRELELLGALAAGKTNRQIGAELFIAPATVKYHLANLYRKLEVANRTEAAWYAHQRGLVVAQGRKGAPS